MVKRIFSILLISVIVFGLYVYKMRSVAMEEGKIFEYRCLNVNPKLNYYYDLLRKNAEKVKEDPKGFSASDEGLKLVDDSIIALSDYSEEETKWLEMQNKYMDSLSFKLFIPSYFKEFLKYENKLPEDYLNESNIWLKVNDGEIELQTGKNQIKELQQKRYKDNKIYFDFAKKFKEIKDWRKKIITVPMPGCNNENMSMPDVQYL